MVDKPRQIINMTIGIVTNDSIAQPEYIGHAVVPIKVLFNFLLVKVRIPVLVQQAGSGGEYGTFAVEIHGASLHHNSRINNGNIIMKGNECWNLIIQVKRRIFSSPRIVTPVNDYFFCFRARVYQE